MRGTTFAVFWAGSTYFVYTVSPKGLTATMVRETVQDRTEQNRTEQNRQLRQSVFCSEDFCFIITVLTEHSESFAIRMNLDVSEYL